MNQNRAPEIDTDKIKKIIIPVVLLIVIIVFIVKSSITIKAGEAGVLFQTFSSGVKIDKTYGEGFHIIAPWNKMVVYTTRQQQVLETMEVLSSNGLGITVEISTWFKLEREEIPLMHKEKGRTYLENIVKPAIRSATRSVVGRYTPEEIYSSKRDVIQTEIFEETKIILAKQYVQTIEVLVRDITLPPTIKSAIENKLKQEQESLEYVFKLQKEEKEAQRIKIAAEGKAQANKILNASLTPNILKEKGIEATLELAKSPNSKVVVIGSQDGMPLILGNE
jgi:regulator of protease activity HflC (stomatin/prohibitin superfamily)